MYQACIFDLDGTLANTLTSIAGFANRALRECGWPEIPVQRYRYLVGNGVVRLLHNMMHEVAPGGYTEAQLSQVRQRYDRYYEAQPMLDVKPYPGVAQLLAALKSAGAKVGVLSNKPDNCAVPVATSLYPQIAFDCVCGQREGIPRKPAPDGALRIAAHFAVPPQACLYIGDTSTDMQTGAAAGMDTIGVLWGFRDRQELAENHARAIVSAPAEILAIYQQGLPADGGNT